MKFTAAAVAFLASFASASQTLKVSNLYIVGEKSLDTAGTVINIVSFTLDEFTDNEVSCSSIHGPSIPTGRITGGCQSFGSGFGAWEFSLDKVVDTTSVILTLYSDADGSSRTGTATVPNVCKPNAQDTFFCDQVEPEDVSLEVN